MARSNAFSGVGTLFKRGVAQSSGTSFAVLAEVNSISGPSMSRDTIDVTSLDSTGGYREFIGGFRDAGAVSLSMNFTLATYDDILIDFQASTSRLYQIVLPDTNNTTFEFSAWVTELSMEVPMDDKVTASVTLKIDGAITMSS